MWWRVFAGLAALVGLAALLPAEFAAAEPTDCWRISGGGPKNRKGQLVDMRVGAHTGYDRIVFEFERGQAAVPAYSMNRADRITADGSGRRVEAAGSVFGMVGFQAYANGPDFKDSKYRGPGRLRPDLPVLAEITGAGEFEGVVSWGIGMNRASCPIVSELTDPPRLVVDLPH